MATRSFGDVLGIELHSRSCKPRKSGITMVIDTGYSLPYVSGVLEAYGHLIDVVKLTDLHLTVPVDVLKAKVKLYREHDVNVQPGGIIVEIARMQKKGPQVLERLRELGFTQIEISSSASSQREAEEEQAFTAMAISMGFKAFGEVGKKFHDGDKTRRSDTELDLAETVREMKALLDGGAEKVYWEGHVLRRIVGDSAADIMAKRESGTAQVLEVAEQVGKEKIVVEVSSMIPYVQRRAQQFWMVRLFGPDVNIGNVRLDEVQFLEHIRLGTWPVFGFGTLGDHPYIQSLEKGDGKASATWWTDIPIPASGK